MRIVPATMEDAEGIAAVYLEAFPRSTAFYFPRKNPTRLAQAVKCGFQLVLLLGARALVAVDSRGRIAGYCIFSCKNAQPRLVKPWLTIILRGVQALFYLSPFELAKLAYGRLLFCTHVQLKDKLPPEGGRIVSIAVSPAYQGKGLGRKLLSQALEAMGPVPVLLEVRADNISARALYQSSGFREYGTTKDNMGPWVIMARPGPGGAKDPS